MSSARPTKQKAPEIPPPPKGSKNATIAPEVMSDKDDKPAELNYKGKGGCYTLDDNGNLVPVKEN